MERLNRMANEQLQEGVLEVMPHPYLNESQESPIRTHTFAQTLRVTDTERPRLPIYCRLMNMESRRIHIYQRPAAQIVPPQCRA
jgi:hypothetical protein